MRSKQMIQRSRAKQRGVVTLVTAIVLMLAVFGVTFYMSNTVISESRILATQLRGVEAFNAAQSGVEYIKSAPDALVSASNASSPQFEVVPQEIEPGLIEIESIGVSEDGSVSRTVTYYVGRKPSDFNPPAVPIVAKGGVNTSGNISAINNYSNLTVWNGLDSGIQGSASTYVSIDGNKNQLSTIKNTSGTATYGSDVITGDVNLANATPDDIVDAFFGYATLSDFADEMGVDTSDEGRIDLAGVDGSVNYCYNVACGSDRVQSFGGSGDYNLSSLAGTVASTSDWDLADWSAWEERSGRPLNELDDNFSGSHFGFTGDAGSGPVSPDTKYIGTPSNPVMIVVDGEVSIPSNTFVFGVVVAQKIRLQSNTSVFGGVVALSNESDAFQGAGGAVVFMDEMLIKRAGQKDVYAPIKSSWKDW